MTVAGDIRPFTDGDAEWVEQRGALVRSHFSRVFQNHAQRFPSHDRLVAKFDQAVADAVAHGWPQFGKFIDFHNELALAELILQQTSSAPTGVEYEARLPRSSRTIDFSLSYGDGRSTYVDAKTVRPKMIDRWEQYEDIVSHDILTPGTEVELHRGWLGGELWHLKMASRARFLEYARELEGKVRAAHGNGVFVLAFFCSGFHWHLDELEDFVLFYKTGRHTAADPLAKMELHYIAQENCYLDRSIAHFAFFKRSTDSMSVESGTWDVEPPRLPF